MTNHSCDKYTSEEISRFIDSELSLEKYQALEKHLLHCTDCNAIVQNYMAMSTTFSNHTEQQISQIDTQQIKTHLHKAMQKPKTSSSHLYLKLASFAIVIMISLFTFQDTIFSSPGPSAIVKSVDTDFASVMIIETQKKRHTIIWFTET